MNDKMEMQIDEKEFDTVKTIRTIKEKISNDIADMNFEQIKAYFKNKKVLVQD